MTSTSSDVDSEPPTILIVEDEKSLADLYAVWLSDSYSVKTVYDGKQAITALTDGIDVVLLDRRMRGISGDEVLETIRARDYDIRVVMISAVTPDIDSIDLEFDDYLVKPADRDRLLEVVERMMTLSETDEMTQKLAQLKTKKEILEDKLNQVRLQKYDEYHQLQQRIETLQSETEEM